MKKQTQNNGFAGQSDAEVRKSQKHEVNVQKNSLLYFQIGLILCLLGTFALLEMRFENTIIKPDFAELDAEIIDYQMNEVKVFVEQKVEEPKTQPTQKLTDTFIEKPDDYVETLEKNILTPDEPQVSPTPTVDPGKMTKIEDPKDELIPIAEVEFVPVFPGCEKFKLNSERHKCLNEKMNKLVQRRFNTDIAIDYGLSGTQRIFVEFKVDKTGNIKDIRTRAPHPKLEDEAKRIANKIPQMTPGKVGDNPVNVVYNLPITFKVRD